MRSSMAMQAISPRKRSQLILKFKRGKFVSGLVSFVLLFNSWIRDSVGTSCCGNFGIFKLAWTFVISLN